MGRRTTLPPASLTTRLQRQARAWHPGASCSTPAQPARASRAAFPYPPHPASRRRPRWRRIPDRARLTGMRNPRLSPRRIAHALAAGLVLVALAAGARWVAMRHAAMGGAAGKRRRHGPRHRRCASRPLASKRRSTANRPASTSIPGGLSAAQWQTPRCPRIEPGPEHDRELARIACLSSSSAGVARFRELHGDPRGGGRATPAGARDRRRHRAHLALRETTGAEAVLLKTRRARRARPDAALREAQLEAFRRRLAAANPPGSDPRIAEYHRQEAAIVADWQSAPASQRDPVELARRLQQLQIAVFNPPGP